MSTGGASDESVTGARLRAIRISQRLSLTEVARQADVSKGFISQLERGLTRASVPTLLRICDVLQIGVGELFSHPAEGVQPGGTRIDMGGEGVREYLLTPAESTEFQVFRSVIDPGGSTGGPYRLEGTVFGLGLRGSTHLVVAGEERILTPGVTTMFPGSEPHQFDNPGTTESEVLWVMSPPLQRNVRQVVED